MHKVSQKKADQEGKDVSKVRVYRLLTDIIDRKEQWQGIYPKFPEKFHIFLPKNGIPQILLEDENQVVRFYSEDGLKRAINRYCFSKEMAIPFTKQEKSKIQSERFLPIPKKSFQLSPQNVTAAVKHWLTQTDNVLTELPPLVRFDDEPGLCFHRIDFKPYEYDYPTPCFDNLLNRMPKDKHEIFKAFVGSIFDPNSNRSEYLWLYGEGQDGKSAFGRFLGDILGDACSSEEVPTRDDKFWNSGLVGKRLVVFADCDKSTFPTTGRFKTLTGNDYIKVEEKGKAAITVKLDAKFIFLSNKPVELSTKQSDRRRAIIVEIERFDGNPDPTYERRLWDERKYVIGKCIKTYKKHMAEHKRLFVNNENLESSQEDEYQRFFDAHFEITGDNKDRVPKQWITRMMAYEKPPIPVEKRNEYFDYFKRVLKIQLRKRQWVEQNGVKKQLASFVGIKDRAVDLDAIEARKKEESLELHRNG